MTSRIDANIYIEKKWVPRRHDRQKIYWAGGQEGGKGGSEVRKKGRKEEGKKGRREERGIGRKGEGSTRSSR